jgi:hypothetical protein
VDLFIGAVHQARLPGVTFALLPAVPEPILTLYPGPTLFGYRDAAGKPLTGAQPGLSVILIEGRGFGSVRGTVWVGTMPVEVLSWSDTGIRVRLPVGRAAGGRAETVTVFVKGGWYAGLGLEVRR